MKRSLIHSLPQPAPASLHSGSLSTAYPANSAAALQHKRARVRYRTMATLSQHSKRHKVTVVGSGNWGSTIAKVVAENVRANPTLYEEQVQMWVFEEDVTIPKQSKHHTPDQQPQKLSEVINKLHENVKYLPGITLPDNIVANPSLVDSVKDSTILIFNLPHQFIRRICKDLQGKIVPFARGISCIKGVEVSESGITLLSELIGQSLGIYCGALSGANIASEIAAGKYSETTVAYDPPLIDSKHPTPAHTPGVSPSASTTDLKMTVTDETGGDASARVKLNGQKVTLQGLPSEYPPLNHLNIKRLFHRHYFHVRLVSDVAGVSLGGALKNVVALAAGWVDGLGWGDNAKAAVMRVGILEEVRFGKMFFADSCKTETFTEESAGMADVVTSCMGGRNFRCAKMSIEQGIPIEEVEKRELNGQKLQGTLTAYEVNSFLKSQGKEEEFPLFTAVYNILEGKIRPDQIPDLIEPKIVE